MSIRKQLSWPLPAVRAGTPKGGNDHTDSGPSDADETEGSNTVLRDLLARLEADIDHADQSSHWVRFETEPELVYRLRSRHPQLDELDAWVEEMASET